MCPAREETVLLRTSKERNSFMGSDDIKTVSVLGVGVMGHGIAQVFAMGGYDVMMLDVEESILKTARAHIRSNLELFEQFDLIDGKNIESVMERLTGTLDLKKAVENSDFIVESAPEDLELKQQLFQQTESFCREDAIIATNTSSLTLTDIGARVERKERLVITHWFNPPHIVPTVEVVKSERTGGDAMETAYDLLTRVGKVPVKINVELPGFIINRIQIAMVREIFDLYEKGVASAADIDKAIKGSIGFRLAGIGQLLTADLGGLDIWHKVCKNLLPHIRSSTEVSKALECLVSQGHLGIKSGKGFYDYDMDFSKATFDEAVKKRDRDFLKRLKNLYRNKK